MSTPQIWNTQLPNNMTPYAFDGYQFYTTQSEFNASVFVPNYAASEMQLQPTGKINLKINFIRQVFVFHFNIRAFKVQNKIFVSFDRINY